MTHHRPYRFRPRQKHRTGLAGGEKIGWSEFSSGAFDGLRYLASNSDLIASFGADPLTANKHWLIFGRPEGRAPGGFNPLLYGASNPDILEQVGISPGALSEHFILEGIGGTSDQHVRLARISRFEPEPARSVWRGSTGPGIPLPQFFRLARSRKPSPRSPEPRTAFAAGGDFGHFFACERLPVKKS